MSKTRKGKGSPLAQLIGAALTDIYYGHIEDWEFYSLNKRPARKDIGAAAGICRHSTYTIFRGETDPTVDQLRAILKVFGYSLRDFFSEYDL